MMIFRKFKLRGCAIFYDDCYLYFTEPMELNLSITFLVFAYFNGLVQILRYLLITFLFECFYQFGIVRRGCCCCCTCCCSCSCCRRCPHLELRRPKEAVKTRRECEI